MNLASQNILKGDDSDRSFIHGSENMSVAFALLPIISALFSGFVLGKIFPSWLSVKLIRLIAPLVWGLLLLIGFEFGEVISSANSVGPVLRAAVIFSMCTTVVPCLLILLIRGKPQEIKARERLAFSANHVWPALKECLIALSMVFLGGGLFLLQERVVVGGVVLPSSSTFLLLLILLVGVGLAQVKLDRRWFSRSMLTVPVFVVVGSLIGGAVAAWMTDLLRELLAIVLLYAVGRHVSIGSAGATALDSTLPIIKQACSPDAVPLALVSGFILTLLAPVFITVILT